MEKNSKTSMAYTQSRHYDSPKWSIQIALEYAKLDFHMQTDFQEKRETVHQLKKSTVTLNNTI